MTTDHEIEEALQRLKCTTTPAQDKRILADALATVAAKSETGTTKEARMHRPNQQAVPNPEFEGGPVLSLWTARVRQVMVMGDSPWP